MKADLYKISFSSDTSFLYKKFSCDFFNDPWHFHEEIELVAIDKGNGIRFVGNNVSNFEEGDLMLIGSGIPHLFRNNEEVQAEIMTQTAGVTYVHFTRNFLGKPFFNIPEMKSVAKLLDRSALALNIYGTTKKYVISRLHAMNDENPEQRLLSFLRILIRLSQSREMKPLLSIGYSVNKRGDTERINNALDYIMKNYTREIYLQEIASQLHMSVASFSRYFKNHTSKTFSDYVAEIRIGHACRLLMENNLSIFKVSSKSGFNSLPNFYSHFKKIIGIKPKEYKRRFLKVI